MRDSLSRRLGPVAVLVAMALPGMASAQQYFCTVSSTDGNSWIPPEFLIEYSGSSATVSHGWTNGLSARQVQIRGNDARRRLNYTIADVGATNGQRTTMAFRLVHTVASGQLRVTLNPAEYSNSFNGAGTCVPI